MGSLRQLHWSEMAIRDISQIGLRIAADSPESAGRLLERIERKVLTLIAHPQIGRLGVRSGTRELVVHRHYLVVYRILPDRIVILRVKHVARKY
jgi:addiction module RelE/StbE family toxin